MRFIYTLKYNCLKFTYSLVYENKKKYYSKIYLISNLYNTDTFDILLKENFQIYIVMYFLIKCSEINIKYNLLILCSKKNRKINSTSLNNIYISLNNRRQKHLVW